MKRSAAIIVAALVLGCQPLDHMPPIIPQRSGFDEAKLRKALPMPRVSVEFGIGFNSTDGLVLSGEKTDPKPEIARLEKELKGDGSDAARYTRLAELYERIDDEKRSDAASEKAAALYREQLKTQPDNARLLADLAFVLNNKKDAVEIERLLRRAVERAPRDWYCRHALAVWRMEQAKDALPDGAGDLNRMLLNILARKPDPKVLAAVQGHLDAAMGHLNEAVELGPRERKPLQDRAVLRILIAFMQAGSAMLEGKPVNPMALLASEALLADLRKLAELAPEDAKAIGMLAVFEILIPLMNLKANPPKDRPISNLAEAFPEQTQQAMKDAIARLTELTKSKDKINAAAAAEVLGFLYLVALQDPAEAEKNLRRAIEFNPDRNTPWEMLSGFYAITDEHRKAADLGLQWVTHKDGARKRLITAKAFARLGDLDKAEEQARAAVKLEPANISCKMAVAVLLIKRDNATATRQAALLVAEAEKQLKEQPSDALQAEFLVTRAALEALGGDVNKARTSLKDARAADKDNPGVKELLDVIGE